MLHVTQPSNGTLVIESPINEGHVRMYRPGATTTTSAAQTGTITMTSQWNGPALVSEGTLALSTGASSGVKETLAVSADGNVLSIDVVAVSGPRVRKRAQVHADQRHRPVRVLADALQALATASSSPHCTPGVRTCTRFPPSPSSICSARCSTCRAAHLWGLRSCRPDARIWPWITSRLPRKLEEAQPRLAIDLGVLPELDLIDWKIKHLLSLYPLTD